MTCTKVQLGLREPPQADELKDGKGGDDVGDDDHRPNALDSEWRPAREEQECAPDHPSGVGDHSKESAAARNRPARRDIVEASTRT